METDISLLRKPGHFYFALTCVFLAGVWRALKKNVLLISQDGGEE